MYRGTVYTRPTTWGTFVKVHAYDECGNLHVIDLGMMCGYTMQETRQMIHAALDNAGIPQGGKLRWKRW